MKDAIPSMQDLFAQLGLSDAPADMQAFMARNRPLAPEVELADAPFWTSSQAEFLRNGLLEDTAWSIVIDQLNVALRQS